GIGLADADPAAIADHLFWGAFINTGQTCAATERLSVPGTLYDEVCPARGEGTGASPMRVGLGPESQLGPLQQTQQCDSAAGRGPPACRFDMDQQTRCRRSADSLRRREEVRLRSRIRPRRPETRQRPPCDQLVEAIAEAGSPPAHCACGRTSPTMPTTRTSASDGLFRRHPSASVKASPPSARGT